MTNDDEMTYRRALFSLLAQSLRAFSEASARISETKKDRDQ
jgi:hypothetical protein